MVMVISPHERLVRASASIFSICFKRWPPATKGGSHALYEGPCISGGISNSGCLDSPTRLHPKWVVRGRSGISIVRFFCALFYSCCLQWNPFNRTKRMLRHHRGAIHLRDEINSQTHRFLFVSALPSQLQHPLSR